MGNRARLVLVAPDQRPRVISRGFHSACDPEVSFDAERILFAGKRTASDNWNIFEMSVDGSNVRQITEKLGDCRSPTYQSRLYTIVSPKPWYQLTFVGNGERTMDEYGTTVATHLYSCRLDGSAVRRLTFNLSSDVDPVLMPDGRLLFAAWQRSRINHGTLGRVGLFGVNLDGTDYALFAGYEGRRVKRMPCLTTDGLVVFVEADQVPWDGAGRLSCVRIRRPLHSYRPITEGRDGLFHGPAPLPDGNVLVSRRPADGSATHGVYRLDPSSGKAAPVFDDPRYHDVQAKAVHSRTEPDGRSSVVTEEDPHGKLYCLSVYVSDLKDRRWMPPGTVKRLRVLQGIPRTASDDDAAARRILGEIQVEQDGSFNVEVPANTPIELQILDANGLALRSCGWIWAKNHEPRGCIGCHEDGELTPENVLMDAATKPSASLNVPSGQRRTVGFCSDVMPIIREKCVSCHGPGEAPPRLDGGLTPIGHAGEKAPFNRAYASLLTRAEPQDKGPQDKGPQDKGPQDKGPQDKGPQDRGPQDKGTYRGVYVHPGRARTSPLIWHIFGHNTSRPWDGAAAGEPVKTIPAENAKPLSEAEKRTFVQWIDMGASWDVISRADALPPNDGNAEGETP